MRSSESSGSSSTAASSNAIASSSSLSRRQQLGGGGADERGCVGGPEAFLRERAERLLAACHAHGDGDRAPRARAVVAELAEHVQRQRRALQAALAAEPQLAGQRPGLVQ